MSRKILVNRRDLKLLFDALEALQIRKRSDLMDRYLDLGIERLSIKAAREKARLLAEMRRDLSVIEAIRTRRKHYLGPKSKSVWEILEEKQRPVQRNPPKIHKAKKARARFIHEEETKKKV